LGIALSGYSIGHSFVWLCRMIGHKLRVTQLWGDKRGM
jgi:hypothetical protein